MKCAYCGKKINEMTEKYHVYTLDGDFIHDECEQKKTSIDGDGMSDLLTFINECDIEELKEFLKSYNVKFTDDE